MKPVNPGTPLLKDPLLLAMIGTAAGLAVLVVGIATRWGSTPMVAAVPWVVPMVATLVLLTGLCVATLALGRYQVLHDPVSFWVGLGFASLCVGQVFYVLTWPGLLPDGGAILARLSNTPTFITNLNLTLVGGFLLAAVLTRWPEERTWDARRGLWAVAIWLVVITFTLILVVSFEQYLPVLVRPDGTFTRLPLGWAGLMLLLFAAGSILSARHYRVSRDALAGYVAFSQMAMVFIILMTIIGGERYDLWWYIQRVVLVAALLIVLFGLLSDYLHLLRRESQGRLMLEAVLANVPIGLTITGGPPDFRLERASQYGLALNQRPAEGLIGIPAGEHQAAWNIYLPDGVTLPLPEQMPLFRASRFGEEIRDIELLMKSQDGRKIPVLVSAAPVRGAHGRIVAAINTWQDITQIKEAEEALLRYAADLERSNRDLQEFAYVASHDLQEPLRKIESFGDLLLESSANLDDQQCDLAVRMQKSARRMRLMVDRLLELSRLETQAQPFQPVNLEQIIQEVISDLEMQIRQTAAIVDVCELPVIEADPAQMRRLFQNLIGNGLKFQLPGEKPRVRVCVETSTPAAVQIRVSDNGIGFDEAYAGHLFEPFKRLVGRSEYEGTGMGLAICRKIVIRHQGEITARSQPGQGASFLVTLPIRQT